MENGGAVVVPLHVFFLRSSIQARLLGTIAPTLGGSDVLLVNKDYDLLSTRASKFGCIVLQALTKNITIPDILWSLNPISLTIRTTVDEQVYHYRARFFLVLAVSSRCQLP
jgi:hypothetical protein